MQIVEATIERLGVPHLSDLVGYALLGSTTPDRRIMSEQSREETHYFRLTEDGEGDGIRRMFESCDDLREARGLTWRDRAFLVGYLSHLAADEAWIVSMYRPYFGGDGPLGTDPHHNILDRALLYSLDMRVTTQRDRMDRYRGLLENVDPKLNIRFIESDFLEKWLEPTKSTTDRVDEWARFERFIQRFRSDPGVDENRVAAYLENPDSMLEQVFEDMPRHLPDEFLERAVDRSLKAAQEYLI